MTERSQLSIAGDPAGLGVLGSIIDRCRLESLRPLLAACRELASPEAPLDVAVLGQFKAGKSSMLNAIVGMDLLPVGVLPVTAVVTRLVGGDLIRADVTRLDGTREEIDPRDLADYVSEENNPGNAKHIAAVDVQTPTLAPLPGLRLVDTPGLGSTHAHNTQATMDWLPSVAAALVAVSVERPLSEEDRRLIAMLRPLASRVVIVLTKADLVSDADLERVRGYVGREVRDVLELPPGREPTILQFSVRQACARHVEVLREGVLGPLARNATVERATALAHKVHHLAAAARDYLAVALKAAERSGGDRQALLAAVMDESVNETLILKELTLATESVLAPARAGFEEALKQHASAVESHVVQSLAEMKQWEGHLGKQAERFRDFLAARLAEELAALDPFAAPIAASLVEEAQKRLRRVTDGFRQRLGSNVQRTLGVEISTPAWDPPRVVVTNPTVVVGQTFMTHWDLFWWALPMFVVGGLFRWHCRRKVPWEVWINTLRAASGWYVATAEAVDRERAEAAGWVHGQLGTLTAMLSATRDESGSLRSSLVELGRVMEEHSQKETC